MFTVLYSLYSYCYAENDIKTGDGVILDSSQNRIATLNGLSDDYNKLVPINAHYKLNICNDGIMDGSFECSAFSQALDQLSYDTNVDYVLEGL